MRKSLLLLIVALAAFACTQQSGFEIKVQLDGAEGEVLLENRIAGTWLPVDTAEIVDGKAVLKGSVEAPAVYYLSIVGERAKTMVFVENKSISVVGRADSLQSVKVSGSNTHDEYDLVNQEIKEITEKYMALYQEARSASAEGDTSKYGKLMLEVDELYESTQTLQETFVKENPSSYVSPYFLSRIQYGKEVEELDMLVTALDPKLDNVQTVLDLKERVAKLKTVTVGKTAPDFVQNDAEGNPVRFSEIYSQNELTLLDFWASWCGPCRRENPNVVSVFTEFKGNGFNVFGVSLDRDKDAWLKAIDDDKLTWPHVSDLAYWNNSAAKLYAVNSIPSNLLVDKNGKIVAKNKKESELKEFVSNYFATKP